MAQWMRRNQLFLGITLWSLSQCSSLFADVNGTGLSVSAAVDAVGAFKVGKDSKAKDTLEVREAELSLYAPIDHIFDGILSLAAHRESGMSLFELHEAVICSTKLIPGMSLRVGQYFLGVGRLNRFHRHDWPFISAPKVFSEFFGEEGVLDTGGEISYLVPTLFFLDITAGVTNGWVYGHAHNEGKKPKTPTHYLRMGTFLDPSDDLGLALGGNYLGRISSDGTKTQLFGLDGVAKWNRKSMSLLVQGETWLRQLEPEAGDEDVSLGSYLYQQVGFSKNFYAGFRLDYFTVSSLKDATGKKIHNAEYAVVPTVTYKTSEFATFRLAYSNSINTQEYQTDKINQSVQLQSIFILGAHPTHDF